MSRAAIPVPDPSNPSAGAGPGANGARMAVDGAAQALAEWFASHQRDLPWRAALPPAAASVREPVQAYSGKPGADPAGVGMEPVARRDPYRTWISEIMLQQTQVATVVDYFHRWMGKFPDLAALAAASEQDVLAAWAGLGYYSRARNVLATARKVVEEHGGRFPWRREHLLGLKGVGEYTAGAIASLSFNLPEPILDGNLVRVFSRLYALDFLPDSKAGKKAYWDLARAWAGAHDAALVNEGLMELGALICTPRAPDCAHCPLTRNCAAFKASGQTRLPPARSRKGTEEVAGFVVAVFRGHKDGEDGEDGEEVLLFTPAKGERLAGLLTFPLFRADGLADLQRAWREAVPGLAAVGLRPRPITVSHSITHHRYRLRVAEARLATAARGPGKTPAGYSWHPIGELDRLLVSSLPRKIWSALR